MAVTKDSDVLKVKCRFCGKEVDATKLLYGKKKDITICEDCLNICNSIVADRKGETHEVFEMKEVPKPMELKKKLDEYIVGQEKAKKIISVAVYNHYKRIAKLKDSAVQKANICLIGSSGSGKTLIAQTVAKLLDVPIVIADCTSFTSAGYVGRNVEDCLASLVKKADGDVAKAERGIVFLDEIDKIAGHAGGGTKDVGGEGVQQALLKMIEGTTMYLPKEKENFLGGEEQMTIDTTNILFIVSGAFVGIEKFIKAKEENKGIGFGSSPHKLSDKEKNNLLDRVTQEHLIKFGMIPEFVGRIQTIAVLHKLDEEAMVKILQEPKDALIKQYQQLMEVDGVSLKFDNKAIHKIAKMAMKNKTGARSLKSILENTMLDIMYTAPTENTKEIVIKEEDVKAENV